MGDNLSRRIQDYIESLIYWGAGHGNTLPLTSRCNVQCVFCSNLQNPPGVEVFNIKPRTPEQIQQTLVFIDRSRPLVIGESVTRINEGEPFSHPQIEYILNLIRSTYPQTPVQITTNGSLLDKKRIIFLKSLAPLKLYLSLNSASVLLRNKLMRDPRAGAAVQAAALLGEYGIPWDGSVVAMPHLTGWEDLRSTVQYMADCGALTIRVFMPGFTRYAPAELRFTKAFPEKLRRFIQDLKASINVPLTLEPPFLNDLIPEVAGVLRDSPAWRAGIRQGDVITAVNGAAPFSRVHAFHLAAKTAKPSITLRRPGGVITTLTINKEAGDQSGLVMDYDMDPATVRDIEQSATRHSAVRVLVITSPLAASIINASLQRQNPGFKVHVLPVVNRFFGGSIKTAGLLVVEDMLHALQAHLARHPRPDIILAPGIAFDHRGRDLTGRHWSDLEQFSATPVCII